MTNERFTGWQEPRKRNTNWALLCILIIIAPTLFTIIYDGYRVHWSDYMQTYNYFVGYKYGWGGRKFLGTIIEPLLPQFVTAKTIRNIVIPSNIIMMMLTSLMVWLGLPKKREEAIPLALFLALYLASPFSILNYVFSDLSLVCIETYQLLLLLLWIIAYIRGKDKWCYYILTFTVPICCLLIHHTFFCTLYPLMLGLFIFDTMRDGKPSTKKVIVYGLNVLMLLVLFLALWLYGEMNIDKDSLYETIARRANSDVLPDKNWLTWYYYMSNEENTVSAMTTEIRIRFVLEFLIMLPLIVVLAAPWWLTAKRATSWGNRMRYILPPICVILFTIPVFMMAYDYSRWWICLFFQLIVLLITSHDDDHLKKSLLSLSSHAVKHWYVVLLLMAFLLQLHNSSRMFAGLEESERLMSFVKGLLP